MSANAAYTGQVLFTRNSQTRINELAEVVNDAAARLTWTERLASPSGSYVELRHLKLPGGQCPSGDPQQEVNLLAVYQDWYPWPDGIPNLQTLETFSFHNLLAVRRWNDQKTGYPYQEIYWRIGNLTFLASQTYSCSQQDTAPDAYPLAEALFLAAQLHGLNDMPATEDSPGRSHVCTNQTCPDYCVDSTSYSAGVCDSASGICTYSATTCPQGCDPGSTGCLVSAPLPPAPPRDLSLRSVNLIQSIEGSRYAAFKPAGIRAEIVWADPDISVQAQVTLGMDGVSLQSAVIDLETGEDKTGDALVSEVDFHLSADLLTPGDHTFTVETALLKPVSPSNNLDADQSNNQSTLDNIRFEQPGQLTLLVQSFSSSQTQEDLWLQLSDARQYLLNVLPVQKVTYISLPQTDQQVNLTAPSDQLAALAFNRLLYNSQLAPGQPPAELAIGLFPDGQYADTASFYNRNLPHSILLEDGSSNRNTYEALARPIALDKGMTISDNAPAVLNGLAYRGQQSLFMELLSDGETQYSPYLSSPVGTQPLWTDAYSWDSLLDLMSGSPSTFQPEKLARPDQIPGMQQAGSGFVLTGSIGSNHVVEISSFLWLEMVEYSDAAAASEYRILALGANGETLADWPITLDFQLSNPAAFVAVIPASLESTEQLRITHQGNILWQRNRPASAPLADIQTPITPVPLSGPLTVRWEASDADGDPLNSILLYSADDSLTWLPVAIDLTGISYTLDTDSLPGGERCRLRVLISDGWYTATATTASTFRVANKLPDVKILSAEDVESNVEDGSTRLRALAYDLEDGLLTGSNVTWFSFSSQMLGKGEHLTLAQSEWDGYPVTVLAHDSSAAQAVDSSPGVVVGETPSAPEANALAAPANLVIPVILSIASLGGLGLAVFIIVNAVRRWRAGRG